MNEDASEAAETHSVIVTAAQAGGRIDRVLAEALPDLSRSRIKSLLAEGNVMIDGVPAASPSAKVGAGMVLEVGVPLPHDLELVAEAIPLFILYEDAHLLVVDKPAGLVVHPAPGNPSGTLVNALLHHCGDSLAGIGGVRRPGIVHRIDKDTSGLLVVAKDQAAHEGLVALFAAHDIDRVYDAIVFGRTDPPSGRIEGAIGRDPRDRKKMAVVAENKGRHAVTNYTTRRFWGQAASHVECRLETGRTHQIRVHMTRIGHPLIGDPVYGRATPARLSAFPATLRDAVAAFPRQALHARHLGFAHPITGKSLAFDAGMPADMADLLARLDSVA